MRLIDADKITPFNCLAMTGNAVCCHAEGIVSKSTIEMQPTVDAIPIEWIKSKVDTILKSYPNGNEETEIICKLLYEWEKENEINRLR